MLIPDHETAVDLLNYQSMSTTISRLLHKNREKPVTIGIHGSWGAGKSSILKMIEEDLSGGEDTLCILFNGWTFQGFDDAKIVLIETIVEELRRKRGNIEKVKELSGNLFKRLDWLKATKKLSGYALTATTGIPSIEVMSNASSLLENGLSGLKNICQGSGNIEAGEIENTITSAAALLKSPPPLSVPEAMHHFRKEFEELLKEAKITQLIILIDDLDRCLPKTAIETLEAIRLFLFVPKSAFIVAADEAMIEYSVKQHFPDLPHTHESTSYARNYLEKLIQVPFRIPSMGAQETKTYVTLLLVQNVVGENDEGFKGLLEKAKAGMIRPWDAKPLELVDVKTVSTSKKSELAQAYLIGQQIGEKLAEGTSGNPRQIKRFLNSMLLRKEIADALGYGREIDEEVLAKLMLAEMAHKDFYDELSRIVLNSPTGMAGDLIWLEDETKIKKNDKKSKKEDEPKDVPEHVKKWLDQIHIKSWASISPKLSEIDLRPYVFVARDKRLTVAEGGSLDALGELKSIISKSSINARKEESRIENLSPSDAERLFNGLREDILKEGLLDEPKAFEGIRLVVKHHRKHQSSLLHCVSNIDTKKLGPWIIKGWEGILTTEESLRGHNELLEKLAKQDGNPFTKQAAKTALESQRTK